MKTIIIHKWILILAIIIALVPIATACGTKDIDKRMFVIAIGIDKSEDDEKPYKVTLKVPLPTNNKASQTADFIYLTEASETIGEAIHILTSHVDKNLEFSHAKFFVLGENILDEDLRLVMDIFLRRRDFQQTAWMTVGRPSAETVIKSMSNSNIPDINILFNRFSNIGTESSYIVSMFLFDFRRRLIENGIDPVIPIIELNGQKSEIIINKAIVISDDQKNLELSSEQTEDYNALSNKLKSTTFRIRVVNENQDFTVMVDKFKVKYKLLTAIYGKPVIHMKLDINGIVEQSIHLMSYQEIDTYNELTSEVIEDRITKFLTLLQKNKVDPIGFGLRYEATHWHKQDIEDEWIKLYSEIDFSVDANVSINSLGSIQ